MTNISVEHAQLGIDIAAILQKKKVPPAVIRHHLRDPDEFVRRIMSNDPPVVTITISNKPSEMADAVTDAQLKMFTAWTMRFEAAYLREAIAGAREILNLLTPLQLAFVLTTSFKKEDYRVIYRKNNPELEAASSTVVSYVHALYRAHQEQLATQLDDFRTLDDIEGGFDEHVRLHLMRLGVHYLVALTEWTRRDVLRTARLKRRRLEEIRRMLRTYGYHLSGDLTNG